MGLATTTNKTLSIPSDTPFSEYTPDWLRSFKGCEKYNDEQAIHAIKTLDKLAKLLFEFTCQKNGIIIDNQLIVHLQTEKEPLKSAA